jgi:hypothetical protein
MISSILPEANSNLDFVDPAGTHLLLGRAPATLNPYECNRAIYVSMLQNGTDLMVGNPDGWYSMSLPVVSGLDYYYSSGTPCSTAGSNIAYLDNNNLLAEVDFVYSGTDGTLSLDGVSVSGSPTYIGSIGTAASLIPVVQPDLLKEFG